MTSDEGKGIKGIRGIQNRARPGFGFWLSDQATFLDSLDSSDSFDSFVLRVVIPAPLCYLLWVRSRNPFLRDVDRE